MFSMVCMKCKGFTILEVMIALVIMTILLSSAGSLLQIGRDFDHNAENKLYMNQVYDGLLTFVQVNGYLPCPDTDGDGTENRNVIDGLRCNDSRGRIPFLDLGVSATDAWNQPLYYAVNRRTRSLNIAANIDSFVSPASYFNNQVGAVPLITPFFRFSTQPVIDDFVGEVAAGSGNYRICSGAPCNASSGTLLEEAAIAVVVSFGKNGAQTWNNIDQDLGTTGLSVAEAENSDGNDLTFWLAQGSNVEGKSFDDQLFWLTGHDVKYAVIKAGGVLLP